jgi:hypothetical protein
MVDLPDEALEQRTEAELGGGTEFLKGFIEEAAAGFAEQASALDGLEVSALKAAMAEEVPDPLFGAGSQDFKEVAGEGLAAVRGFVVEADAGVEASDQDLGDALGVQEGVGEREGSIDGVAGRAAVAGGEGQGRSEEFLVGVKEGRGGGSLHAQEAGEGKFGGLGELALELGEAGDAVQKLAGELRPLAGGAKQESGMAAELGANQEGGHAGAPGFVRTELVLEQAAAGIEAVAAAQEGFAIGAEAGQHEQAAAMQGHSGEGGGVQEDIALDNDVAKQAKGDAALEGAAVIQSQGVAIAAHFEAGLIQVEGGHGQPT